MPPRRLVDLPTYERLPRRPWALAAPWRRERDLDADPLVVHTFQSREAFEVLQRDGVLVGDSTKDDFTDEERIAEAYAWLQRRMAQKLDRPVDGMVWAWVGCRRRHLLQSARHCAGDVLVTARVPRERLVLTHYGDWHQVLNRSLDVPMRPGESLPSWERRFDVVWEAWADRTEPYRELPISSWPAALRAELESSWESVFQPARSTDFPGALVQATLTRLEASDVERCVRIV